MKLLLHKEESDTEIFEYIEKKSDKWIIICKFGNLQ